MIKITDDDFIIQIATERGDSRGNSRHAIQQMMHSTFTEYTQYTDKKATLNEKQFVLLPPSHDTEVGCLRGRHLTKRFQGCSQHITSTGHQQEHAATVISLQVKS